MARDYPPFGRWLRARRLKVGLTQQELGDLLGKTQAYVARWETLNRGVPNQEDLHAFADVLNVTIDEMLAVFGGKPVGHSTDVPILARLRTVLEADNELDAFSKSIIAEALDYVEFVQQSRQATGQRI